MVRIGQCFVTKFGSIWSNLARAHEAEIREERDDFALKLCNIIAPWADGEGYWFEFSKEVYEHRKAIQVLIKAYSFIDPNQKDKQV